MAWRTLSGGRYRFSSLYNKGYFTTYLTWCPVGKNFSNKGYRVIRDKYFWQCIYNSRTNYSFYIWNPLLNTARREHQDVFKSSYMKDLLLFQVTFLRHSKNIFSLTHGMKCENPVIASKQKHSFLHYVLLSNLFQEECKVIYQTPGVNDSKQC